MSSITLAELSRLRESDVLGDDSMCITAGTLSGVKVVDMAWLDSVQFESIPGGALSYDNQPTEEE